MADSVSHSDSIFRCTFVFIWNIQNCIALLFCSAWSVSFPYVPLFKSLSSPSFALVDEREQSDHCARRRAQKNGCLFVPLVLQLFLVHLRSACSFSFPLVLLFYLHLFFPSRSSTSASSATTALVDEREKENCFLVTPSEYEYEHEY